MAGVLYGADVAQLRAMAAQAGNSAATLQGLQRRLAGELAASVHWQGHDAAAFRSDWERRHSPSLVGVVRLLEAMQRELAANADQQEQASAGDASPGASRKASPDTETPDTETQYAEAPDGPVAPPALQAMTPRQVLDWWNGLDAGQQAGFVRGFPAAAGNTDGLPVAARIEANRLTAQSRLAVLEQTGKGGTEEAEYLKDTVSGSIKLVAYDPAAGNLVQMIGDYDGDTTTVLTYVPGTFATAGDFYGGTAQKMAAFLQQSDPAGRTAALVYKNSEFPQDRTFRQSADKAFGERAGRKLAAFEAGLEAQNPPAARSVAVSHSWGEAAVASSETFGVHYDTQISLSGAWMPEDWMADPGTSYHHFAYDFDALATAQQLGLVGDKYPLGDPAFRQHIYDDPARNYEFGPVKITTDPMAKIDNHSLIASAQDARNRQARDDVARVVFGGR